MKWRPGAHPELGGHLQLQVGQPVGRDQPAVGDTTGEVRLLGAEQQVADGRVDAVGAHQQLELDVGAVAEPGLDVVAAVGQIGELVAEMDPVGGQRVGQGGEQVGTVDLVLGVAEGGLQRCRQRRAQQGAAVVKAPLMPGQRRHPGLGQLLGQPEAVQHPCGVGADLQAGAYLAQHRGLLVDLDLEAGLQQRQGGAEAPDAAADDADRGPVRPLAGSCHHRWPVRPHHPAPCPVGWWCC